MENKETINVVVSNIALPSQKIGSWVTRLNKFLKNVDFFDFVLSPNGEGVKNIYCDKKKIFLYKGRLRNYDIRFRVCRSYLSALKKLSKKYEEITLVIIDDGLLLEAFALNKAMFKCKLNLVFSFHGHLLTIPEHVLLHVDKVLFLTDSGYQYSKQHYNKFTPSVEIIGNGIDSEIFYPLEYVKKVHAKVKMGYEEDDKILIWMANERPVKGLHIFKPVVKQLLITHPHLKILILGNNRPIDLPNTKCLGRMPNVELAQYLQIGDYYMFTSLCQEGFGLSMIEALKSGNTIIASDNGGISEVLRGLPNTYLVNNPNVINAWVEAFDSISNKEKQMVSKANMDKVWNYENWELKFKNAIQL